MSKAKAKVKVEGEKKKVSESEQVEFLRSQLKTYESEIAAQRKVIGSQKELAYQVSSAVQPYTPLKSFKYSKPKKGVTVIPTLLLGDWQIGEVINADETEGFGEFNWEIAQARIYGIVDDFLKWVNGHRGVYKIDECHVVGLADWVSGNIHEELRNTNEFPLPEQAAKAGLLLGEVLRIIAPHFKSVKVTEVSADNHGRLGIRPMYKKRAHANMSYLVYTIANSAVEKCGNVYASISPAIKHVSAIGDYKFLCEHGNECKSWMGIPYYGFERMLGREARKRMNTDKGFHYWIMGHWHVPALISSNIIVNGCLTGTTEFDHGQGRAARPSQVAFMVGKHGLFNFTPFGA